MVWKSTDNTKMAILLRCVLFAIATFELMEVHVQNDTLPSKWYRDTSLDNKISISGHGLTSRSLIRCANACAANNTCLSFFFLTGQPENCMMHRKILHPESPDLIDVPGSVYYITKNEPTTTTAPTTTTSTTSTTTTAPTTTTTTPSTTTTAPSTASMTFSTTTTASTTTATPPPTTPIAAWPTTTPSGIYPFFSCPADDTVFRTVTLTDNTLMAYRVFKTLKNQTDAAASCVSECGFLARVTTLAKMNMLRTLANCTGYSSNDYYVDGSNAQSEPTWDRWVMSNDDLVPMSTDFWVPGTPGSPATDHCLRMKTASGHKWNDCLCSNTYFYICEQK